MDGIRCGLELKLVRLERNGLARFALNTGFIMARSARNRIFARGPDCIGTGIEEIRSLQLLEPYLSFTLYAPQECLSGLITIIKCCAAMKRPE